MSANDGVGVAGVAGIFVQARRDRGGSEVIVVRTETRIDAAPSDINERIS